MNIIKRILRHTDPDTKIQEVLYFQTSADMVKREDGEGNVESDLNTLTEKLDRLQSSLDDLETRIKTLAENAAAHQAALNILNGTSTGSVAKSVSDAIATIVADAPETFDTLKEVSDWIATHEDDAADLIARIAALEGRNSEWQLRSIS